MKEFTPQFDPRDPEGNHLQILNLLLLEREDQVPVRSISFLTDDKELTIAVGPDSYRAAVVPLYLMTLSGERAFWVTDSMRRVISQIYGGTFFGDVIEHPELQVARALRQPQVHVSLGLLPHYREHLATGRSPEEVIRFAWEKRRDDITPMSPEPFLREALEWLFRGLESKSLHVSDAPGHWPTTKWADRALDLQYRLRH